MKGFATLIVILVSIAVGLVGAGTYVYFAKISKPKPLPAINEKPTQNEMEKDVEVIQKNNTVTNVSTDTIKEDGFCQKRLI